MCSILKSFEFSAFEREVISSLRELKRGTAGEIAEALTKKRGAAVPYTTVSSALKRLYSDNIIGREAERFRGKQRKRYVYVYKDIVAEYIDSVVGGLLATFGKSSVVHLAERLSKTDITDEQLDEIRKHLNSKD